MSFHRQRTTKTAPYPKTSPRHAQGGSRASRKFSAPDSDGDRDVPHLAHTRVSRSDICDHEFSWADRDEDRDLPDLSLRVFFHTGAPVDEGWS